MTRTVLVTGGAGFIGSNLAAWLAARRRPRPDPRRPHRSASRRTSAGTPHELQVGLARRPGSGPDGRRPASMPSSTSRPGPASTTRSATRSAHSRPTSPGRSGCSRRPVWRASGGSCSPRPTRPPATTSRRATRPTSRIRCRRTAPPSSRSRRMRGRMPRPTAWPPARCGSRTPTGRTPCTSGASWQPGCERRSPGEPITIHGDGQQTRDFVYVDDLAAAITAVLDAPEDVVAGELFQAGTGVETTIAAARRDDRAGGRAGRSRSSTDRRGPGTSRRNVAAVDKAAPGPRLSGRGPPRRRAGADGRVVRRRRSSEPALAGVMPTPRPARSERSRPMSGSPADDAVGRPDGVRAAGGDRAVAAVARRARHDRHPVRAGDPDLRHRHRAGAPARSVGQGSLRARPALLASWPR